MQEYMRLKYEPASEPLHSCIKALSGRKQVAGARENAAQQAEDEERDSSASERRSLSVEGSGSAFGS